MKERVIDREVATVKSGSNESDMHVRHVAPLGVGLEDAAEERGVIIFNPGIGGGIPEEGEPIASRMADQTGMVVVTHSLTLADLIKGTNVFETAVPASRETAARLAEPVLERYRKQMGDRVPHRVAQSLGTLIYAMQEEKFGNEGGRSRLLIAPAGVTQNGEDYANHHNLQGASLEEAVESIPQHEEHWKRHAVRMAIAFAAIGGSRELMEAVRNRDPGILAATSAINREMAPAGPIEILQAFGVLAFANVLPLVQKTEHVVVGTKDPFVDSGYLKKVFDSRFVAIPGAGHDHPKTVSGAQTHITALKEAGLSYPVDS